LEIQDLILPKVFPFTQILSQFAQILPEFVKISAKFAQKIC